MTIDVILVRNDYETKGRVVSANDRPGWLGLRSMETGSTIYLSLGDLEFMMDEARRAQGA